MSAETDSNKIDYWEARRLIRSNGFWEESQDLTRIICQNALEELEKERYERLEEISPKEKEIYRDYCIESYFDDEDYEGFVSWGDMDKNNIHIETIKTPNTKEMKRGGDAAKALTERNINKLLVEEETFND